MRDKKAYDMLVQAESGVVSMTGSPSEPAKVGISIADIASYPWVLPERQSQDIEQFPHLKRWKEANKARPAPVPAYALAREINPTAGGVRTEEEKKILFGQTKDVVR
jgi:hypothetical protein